MTSGIGELNANWSQMRDFIDKVWDKLSEEDQKFLLERLRVCLKGKILQGVDSRTMLELLVLEEQGYITIVDGGIVYHSDYINSQLDQLEIKKMGAEAGGSSTSGGNYSRDRNGGHSSRIYRCNCDTR